MIFDTFLKKGYHQNNELHTTQKISRIKSVKNCPVGRFFLTQKSSFPINHTRRNASCLKQPLFCSARSWIASTTPAFRKETVNATFRKRAAIICVPLRVHPAIKTAYVIHASSFILWRVPKPASRLKSSRTKDVRHLSHAEDPLAQRAHNKKRDQNSGSRSSFLAHLFTETNRDCR